MNDPYPRDDIDSNFFSTLLLMYFSSSIFLYGAICSDWSFLHFYELKLGSIGAACTSLYRNICFLYRCGGICGDNTASKVTPEAVCLVE